MYEVIKVMCNGFVLMLFTAVPLAVWKLVDIVIWIIKFLMRHLEIK